MILINTEEELIKFCKSQESPEFHEGLCADKCRLKLENLCNFCVLSPWEKDLRKKTLYNILLYNRKQKLEKLLT